MPNHAFDMMRAATCLSVAALEWDKDRSDRQAINSIMVILNEAQHTLAYMKRETEKCRHGKS